MNNWSANHGSISYGHIGADLISLAAMLRIPVAMHNVDEGEDFPAEFVEPVWRAGTAGGGLPRLPEFRAALRVTKSA